MKYGRQVNSGKYGECRVKYVENIYEGVEVYKFDRPLKIIIYASFTGIYMTGLKDNNVFPLCDVVWANVPQN
ncbi:hypothetical protein H4R19_001498 [Coemansia spiralis]|nr:hypothetical protein H4R19_001498 [Coemansia spiralis]